MKYLCSSLYTQRKQGLAAVLASISSFLHSLYHICRNPATGASEYGLEFRKHPAIHFEIYADSGAGRKHDIIPVIIRHSVINCPWPIVGLHPSGGPGGMRRQADLFHRCSHQDMPLPQ